MKLYLVPKEAEFNIEQHIRSPPGRLLGNFFVAKKGFIAKKGFSLGTCLRKYGIQNTRFFQYFYFQTELNVNKI